MHPVPLHPIDVVVALRLAEAPDAKYAGLAADLGVSMSTVHGAVERLHDSALLRPESRSVNWLALREFLQHGVRYAFPARPGAVASGVPTAYAAAPLSSRIISSESVVWPAAGGSATGAAIAPLYPRAHQLPERCPSLYTLLVLTDALRVGRARERQLALEELDSRLGPTARAA
jgi:hypothetical protein